MNQSKLRNMAIAWFIALCEVGLWLFTMGFLIFSPQDKGDPLLTLFIVVQLVPVICAVGFMIMVYVTTKQIKNSVIVLMIGILIVSLLALPLFLHFEPGSLARFTTCVIVATFYMWSFTHVLRSPV